MTALLYVIGYFVIAIITAGIMVEDMNDSDDVLASLGSGVVWPGILALVGIWWCMAGVVKIRDYVVKKNDLD